MKALPWDKIDIELGKQMKNQTNLMISLHLQLAIIVQLYKPTCSWPLMSYKISQRNFSIYELLVTIEVAYSDEEEIRKIMKNAGYSVYKEILERGKYLSKISEA